MFEPFILGMIQGIAEWLPISSEGLIVLVKNNFFGGGDAGAIIKTALFLHLGTFLAALIYFRKDVGRLLMRLGGKRRGDAEAGKILKFLIVATIISGALGWILLKTLGVFEGQVMFSSKLINLAVALLLIITGVLQLKARNGGQKDPSEITTTDTVTLGLAQGIAVLPGLSRSGLTVSALLLRKMQDHEALRLSFLMSLPIVLAGNILLNFNGTVFSWYNAVALLTSFVFGYATINLFIRLARKINFGLFVLIFAGLLILSVLI